MKACVGTRPDGNHSPEPFSLAPSTIKRTLLSEVGLD